MKFVGSCAGFCRTKLLFIAINKKKLNICIRSYTSIIKEKFISENLDSIINAFRLRSAQINLNQSFRRETFAIIVPICNYISKCISTNVSLHAGIINFKSLFLFMLFIPEEIHFTCMFFSELKMQNHSLISEICQSYWLLVVQNIRYFTCNLWIRYDWSSLVWPFNNKRIFFSSWSYSSCISIDIICVCMKCMCLYHRSTSFQKYLLHEKRVAGEQNKLRKQWGLFLRQCFIQIRIYSCYI